MRRRECKFPCECGRYVEIWNLVFMQFDRDAGGTLNPLPKPSIDTGAGLERITAVLQGVVSNYDTDLFTPLIKRAAELTGVSLKALKPKKEAGGSGAASLARYCRPCARSDVPDLRRRSAANEGRGYVLRKIIRRAIRHGRLLGQNKPFLYEMVFAVRDLMKDAYPELIDSAERVAKVVQAEETRFAHTLDIGLRKLEGLLDEADKWLEGITDKGLEKVLVAVRRTYYSGGASRVTSQRQVTRRSRGFQTLRHLRSPAGFHCGCRSRPGHRVRSRRL